MTVPKRPAPYVDPALNPSAARYAQQLANRAVAPRQPAPPMPRLDTDPTVTGMTGAQLAREQARASASPIFTEAPGAPEVELLPDDILPPIARSDPSFRPGVGSMRATENPHLVGTYGFIRGGKFYPPNSNEPVQAGRIRESTQRALAEMQTAAPSKDKGVPDGEVEEGSARDKKSTPERELREMLRFDEYDLAAWRENMDNIFNRPEEANAVKARCIPVRIADIIARSSVEQLVPIVQAVDGDESDRLEVVYRTVTKKEEREIKKLLSEQSKEAVVSESYLIDAFGVMVLTCAMVSINGKPLGSHLDSKGAFDRDAFANKLDKVLNMSNSFLACLGAHYYFFEARIRARLSAQGIKNG